MLGGQQVKLSDFNALNFLDPNLSSPLQTTRILLLT
jgi:hypothetical protein